MKEKLRKINIVLFYVTVAIVAVLFIVSLIDCIETEISRNYVFKEQEQEQEKPKELVIDMKEKNNNAIIMIVAENNTSTEVHGTIKVVNDGKNGEEQRYILYVNSEDIKEWKGSK